MALARLCFTFMAIMALIAQPVLACGGSGGMQMGGGCGGGGCGGGGMQMGGGCGAGGCGAGGGMDSMRVAGRLPRPVLSAAVHPVRTASRIVTGWIAVKPVRTFLNNTVLFPSLNGGTQVQVGSLYQDIQGMLPADHAYAGHGQSPVMDAVDTTIAVSARLSRQYGAHAVYCQGGTAHVLREPHVSLSAVAQAVPANLRGPNFQRMFAGNDPLNLITEWVASQNGAQVGLEMGADGALAPEATGYSMQATEGCAYVAALLQTIERVDPNYADHDKLAEFIGWGMARSINLAHEAQESPAMASTTRDELCQKIVAAYLEN